MNRPFPEVAAPVAPPQPDCWRHVGTGGDRTCPELKRFIHCRNCPVVAAAARGFFDRPIPPGYLDSWRDILERPDRPPATDTRSVLMFRLGSEWFGLATAALAQVVPCRRVHRIPHRTTGAIAGIVNIQGQLHPCIRLDRLIGIDERPSADAGGSDTARMLVLESPHDRRPERWVIGVDEVAEIFSLSPASLRNLPSTAGEAVVRATAAVFSWRGRTVGLLDETRLVAWLRKSVVE